jgi:hypothetical protein
VTLRRIRRIGRTFAILLLAWTAADLCDYGLCEHSREPLGAAIPASGSDAARVKNRTTNVPGNGACPVPCGPDDCFCCSHFVDVQMPFHIALTYTTVWEVADTIAARPHFTAFPLYHPPLA